MTLLRDSITLRHEPHVISMIRAWNVKTQQHSKNWENMYCVEENWNIETILVTSYLQYSCKYLNLSIDLIEEKMNNFDFLLHINYHRTQFLFTFNRKLNILQKCFFFPMPYFRKGHRDIEWLVTISQNL